MNSIFESVEQYSSSSSEAYSSNLHHELASSTPKKCAGRRVFKETRHPVYRGVRGRNNNKWVCEVRVPNDKTTRIWLGTYPTPEMAARAHDVAALALRGKSACLNFADSAWRLPPLLPATNGAKELRRVAMEAAREFAVEDSYQQQQQTNYNGDHQVCSSGDSVVEDNNNNTNTNTNNNNNDGKEAMCLDENQEVPDWLQSMADEPLRSPPRPFLESFGDYGTMEYWQSGEVEEGDLEVSLWSFSI